MQYFFLYYSASRMLDYIKQLGLRPEFYDAVSHPDEFELGGIPEAVARADKRIIMPDFYENPHADKIIRRIYPILKQHNINLGPLEEYYEEKIVKTASVYIQYIPYIPVMNNP